MTNLYWRERLEWILQKENADNSLVHTPFSAIFSRRWSVDKILTCIFVVAWAVFLLVLFIGKFAVSSDGNDYLDHFTSWNWTINTVFFVLLAFSFIDQTRYFRFGLHLFLLWLVFGSCWLVFWLVFVLFANNPDILFDLTIEGGGKYNFGLVLNFNTVYHTLPAILILVYIFLARVEVTLAVGYAIGYFNPIGMQVFFFIWYLLGSLLFIGLYAAIFNVQDIYGITLNVGILAVIGIAIVLVMVGLPLGLFKYRFDRDLLWKRHKNGGRQSLKEQRIRTLIF